VSVRRLGADDAPALHALRREALERHPLAFGAAPGEDRLRTLESTAELLAPADGRVVFGAFREGRLVGMAGMVRASNQKHRHKAGVWGMYVAPGGRHSGLGRALLEALVAEARRWQGLETVQLSVTAEAPEALALYESAGFRVWGREPRSLCWEGRCADEIYLTLDLRGRA